MQTDRVERDKLQVKRITEKNGWIIYLFGKCRWGKSHTCIETCVTGVQVEHLFFTIEENNPTLKIQTNFHFYPNSILSFFPTPTFSHPFSHLLSSFASEPCPLALNKAVFTAWLKEKDNQHHSLQVQLLAHSFLRMIKFPPLRPLFWSSHSNSAGCQNRNEWDSAVARSEQWL